MIDRRVRNARVQLAAMQLGEFKPLSDGEIAARAADYTPHSVQTWRAWHYWAARQDALTWLGNGPSPMNRHQTQTPNTPTLQPRVESAQRWSKV